MFSLGIIQEYVYRAAGRVGNTISYCRGGRRRDIRPAYCRKTGREKSRGKVAQPVRIRSSVIISVGNYLPVCREQPGIAGAAQPAVGRSYHAKPVFSRDIGGSVGRTVINQN